ncbi:MAG: FAD binding domain-containing protein [Chitinivibrionia bacterium]|nr:FAD binding domain-containing protein [Chitinivibrionia bacterium]
MRDVLIPLSFDDLWESFSLYPDSRVYGGGTDLLLRLGAQDSPGSPLICLERLADLQEVRDEGEMVFIGSGCKLGTSVELKSIESSRLLPLRRFIKGPGQVALQPGEILYGIWIRKPERNTIGHFEKVGQRKALAISVASLAALLTPNRDGVIEHARLAWGSVGPTIITSAEAERIMTGKPLSHATLMEASVAAQSSVSPIDDVRASARYRRLVAGNLVMRLLRYASSPYTGSAP